MSRSRCVSVCVCVCVCVKQIQNGIGHEERVINDVLVFNIAVDSE
jgi:hypothetical protein